jgi:hypothetical protein
LAQLGHRCCQSHVSCAVIAVITGSSRKQHNGRQWERRIIGLPSRYAQVRLWHSGERAVMALALAKDDPLMSACIVPKVA